MAESIALYFSSAQWPEVTLALQNFGFCESKQGWRYPTHEEFIVTAYRYDEWVKEMEDEDREKLLCYSGNQLPSCILCVELRRSRTKSALTCTREISIYLLNRFEGFVDDATADFWSLEEITGNVRKSTGLFLDRYNLPG